MHHSSVLFSTCCLSFLSGLIRILFCETLLSHGACFNPAPPHSLHQTILTPTSPTGSLCIPGLRTVRVFLRVIPPSWKKRVSHNRKEQGKVEKMGYGYINNTWVKEKQCLLWWNTTTCFARMRMCSVDFSVHQKREINLISQNHYFHKLQFICFTLIELISRDLSFYFPFQSAIHGSKNTNQKDPKVQYWSHVERNPTGTTEWNHWELQDLLLA